MTTIKLKFLKWVFLAIVILLAIIVPLLWFENKDFDSLDLKTRVEKSPLIVYAIAKPSESGTSMIIQQIWKDSRLGHTAPLIGTQLIIERNQTGVKMPDGEVVFFTKKVFQSKLEAREFIFVNNGLIENMTPEQYKKSCGL
jgi:hypothetical protein